MGLLQARAVDPAFDPIILALAGYSGVQGGQRALSAAADYSGPGALEVPMFEREIIDEIRRTSVALDRIKPKPATGHPHRYFDGVGDRSAQHQRDRFRAQSPRTRGLHQGGRGAIQSLAVRS
jgi:hypothetical protein